MAADIASLLNQSEGPTLDFKATGYDLSDDRQKRDFAKDLASLSNTPRDGDAKIVLGVKKHHDGRFELWGLKREIDDADLQGVASSLLEPMPRFTYETVQHDGVTLGLITIPVGQQSPVAPRSKKDDGFVPGTIYFRRGSQNSVASMQEQSEIWSWFRGDGTPATPPNPYALEPAWTRYLAEVDELSPTSRHILVVDDRFRDDAEALSGIGVGPWAFVLDFDTRSDQGGLLAATRETVERRRALHVRVKGDARTSRSPDVTTTWFFVRGLDGRADSIAAGGARDWSREYRQVLTEEIDRLAGEFAPATVYVTILWRDGEFNEHLKEVFRSLDYSFRDLFRPVFVTEVPTVCQALADDFRASVIEMSLPHFALGVQQLIADEETLDRRTLSLPSASGVPIPIESQTANWIAEEIELVPLGAPKSAEDKDVVTFLRGGTVTWADLDRRVDAERDIQTRLTQAVRTDLDAGRITRFNLFHRPGAGGTTVGRRVAWELHEEFPCGFLRRTAPMETADRIARIYELTEQPVLLIADGTDIAEREVDELAEYLRARRTPVVLVQVRRREAPIQQPGDRTFYLDSRLSTAEVGRFIATLSRDTPRRAAAVEQLGQVENQALHRPVYFALTAYERGFTALPEFVSPRVAGLSEDQVSALVYATVALHYGQRRCRPVRYGPSLDCPLANESTSLYSSHPPRRNYSSKPEQVSGGSATRLWRTNCSSSCSHRAATAGRGGTAWPTWAPASSSSAGEIFPCPAKKCWIWFDACSFIATTSMSLDASSLPRGGSLTSSRTSRSAKAGSAFWTPWSRRIPTSTTSGLT